MTPSALANPQRYLYLGTAILLFGLTAAGFQQFYLHGQAYPGRPLTPGIETLMVLHGLAMTGWILLSIAQPLLIVNGKRGVHAMMGRVGGALAAVICILGPWLAVESAKLTPPDVIIWGLNSKQFLIISLEAVAFFAGFTVIGLWNRRRPLAHRPMMALAALSVIPAATDRIEPLVNLYARSPLGALFGPFFPMLMIGSLFLAVKWYWSRSLDRWFAAGLCALFIVAPLSLVLAKTPAWDAIGTWLLG